MHLKKVELLYEKVDVFADGFFVGLVDVTMVVRGKTLTAFFNFIRYNIEHCSEDT